MTQSEEFDSSEFAFLYFAVSVMIITLIPLTYYTLKHPLRTFIFQSYKKDPRYKRISSHPSAVQKIQLDQQESKYGWLTRSFMVKVDIYIIYQTFIWMLMISIFINSWNQLPDAELMRGFDPYEVLGISRQADTAEIKKAYRKMALQYHPDKSQSDDKMFILVTKAYECLEDPKKMMNCQKYGNPDGYKGFQIGIALPSFIYDPKDQAMYLILILSAFCIIVVGIMFSVFTNMGKYDKNHILQSNVKVYKQALTKKTLRTLNGCFEMVSELDEVKAYRDVKMVQGLKNKNKSLPEDSLGHLLNAHLLNNDLNLEQKVVLHKLLKVAPNALQSAAEYILKWINKIRLSTDKANSPYTLKELTFYTIQCLKAQSHLVQGLPSDAEATCQLTNPQPKIKLYEAAKNIDIATDVEISLFPKVEFGFKIDKFDPEVEVADLHTSDLFLVKFRIEHQSPSMFVHSIKYPFIREHHWHIILLFRDEIIQYTKQTDAIPPLESPIITGEFKVVPYFYTMDPKQSKFVFQLMIFSDSYLDLEYKSDIVITAKPASNRDQEEFEVDNSSNGSDSEEEKRPDNRTKSKSKKD